MTGHDCQRPTDPTEDDPQEWTCPACGRVWERRIEDEPEFYDSWYQPRDDGPCGTCERCTWNPGDDCGKADHPHCPTCAHCAYRHTEQQAIWEKLLVGMADQHMRAEPVTLPAGVVDFEASMSGPRSYRLTATLANGDKVTAERTLDP